MTTNKFTLPDQKPLWQHGHDVLKEMIIHRERKPGERLNEQSLSEQFGVSRGPIRDAILSLQRDGWVEVQHNYEVFVKVPGCQEAEQLFEIRRILESEAAAMAAKRISQSQLDQLKDIINHGYKAQTEKILDASISLNTQFHRVVSEASGNAILARLMEHVEKQVVWFLSAVLSFRGDESWPEHQQLFDALKAGDSKSVAEIMSKHTRATYQAFKSTSEDEMFDIDDEAAA